MIVTISVDRAIGDGKTKTSGNVVRHAILRVDSAFRDEPGRPVSGVVVAVIP